MISFIVLIAMHHFVDGTGDHVFFVGDMNIFQLLALIIILVL